MRMKEEEGLDGSEHLSRATIKQIRHKIRRDRHRSKKKSQKMLQRRMTSMEFTNSSNLGQMTGIKSLPGMGSP